MNAKDTWPIGPNGKRISRPVVYQLDTQREQQSAFHVRAGGAWNGQFLEFLDAHDIRKHCFVMGNSIVVRQHEDDTLWVHTWQALEGHPVCENCPSCIKQERVVTPLVTPVLVPPGCYIKSGWRYRLTTPKEHAA